ncbi:AGE family epimerase/isomerase [Actinotalea fermentans]|uniref:N-acyl-D-glucosamine 2-epimerase n=1 Tax=Actinotalea fermentans TaxID=43671 RepID=A0A511YZ02_9CELL|nr:AGE family epimerase/isomerase [Actinotalea fermentans]KGM15518.1 N-acyl-D-glucosamine 2-epimerase [Actinotalea fermentans ATCC 43279 = JCM 9966 = DSM 3133]GEN80431.1 hypothetical protein AFE02nite_21650 [Actinotalea fermentans]
MAWMGSPAHRRWLEQETDRLLAFARASRVDDGFGWLRDDGTVDDARATELYVTCRMTHVFALGDLLGRPGSGPLADHGVAALTGAFHDGEHGGWFSSRTPDGPADDGKAAYAHAFVVLAASSAAAAGRPGARELLDDALAVSLRYFWEEDAGMVRESWDRAFTREEAYRGVNANMHTVEAYLAAADVTGDDAWLTRALRITERVVHGFAREHDWRLPEHFDPSWQPLLDHHKDVPAHPFRPYGVTIGHLLEWSRLTLHLRAALELRGRAAPAWMLPDAVALARVAVRDGWHADGASGFVYTVGFDGRPVVRERMHWVLCEGIGAAAALATATGDPAYEDWYRRWWDEAAAHVIDPVGGSWWHELDADHRVSRTVWSGKPDVYHALQATLIPRLPLAPTLATAVAEGLLAD